MRANFQPENLKERDHLGDLDADEKLTLKYPTFQKIGYEGSVTEYRYLSQFSLISSNNRQDADHTKYTI
jgi:hypothetical protein